LVGMVTRFSDYVFEKKFTNAWIAVLVGMVTRFSDYVFEKKFTNAWIAQLVEHSPEEGRVPSSSLGPSTRAKREVWTVCKLLCIRPGSKTAVMLFMADEVG
jgi:hypothetical protein